MTRQTFTIAATAALQNKYKDLLRADLSETSLHECLAVLRRLFETSGYRIRFEWEERQTNQRKTTYPIPPAANDYLRDFLERANADVPEELPEQIPGETVFERLVQTVAVFLTFQSRVQLEGDTGFARDLQSLLFQHSIHVLSPKLHAKRLSNADAYLMHALFVHTKIAWTDQPGHQNYLLGLLFEHTGQHEEAMTLLKAALYNSSPDDHDFVTKAQTYWSMLMEAGRLDEAKTFVLELYRRAAPKDLSEIQELLDETYSFRPSRRAS